MPVRNCYKLHLTIPSPPNFGATPGSSGAQPGHLTSSQAKPVGQAHTMHPCVPTSALESTCRAFCSSTSHLNQPRHPACCPRPGSSQGT
jgi:hypothetical protein